MLAVVGNATLATVLGELNTNFCQAPVHEVAYTLQNTERSLEAAFAVHLARLIAGLIPNPGLGHGDEGIGSLRMSDPVVTDGAVELAVGSVVRSVVGYCHSVNGRVHHHCRPAHVFLDHRYSG